MLKITSPALFARPADTTAYASGDLVANSTTAGSVAPLSISLLAANGGLAQVRRARLKKSGVVLTNASFRVHLYSSPPTVTNGDNGVWCSDEAGYLGAFDVVIDKAFSAGAIGNGSPLVGTGVILNATQGSKRVYALIEARAAYTPASAETFSLTLEAEVE